MKDEILTHLNDPGQLEKLYRNNKINFKREFGALYPTLKGNILADVWNERLNYESDGVDWGTRKEIVFVVLASLIAGFIAKLPDIFTLDEEIFYSRNIGFIIFPMLTAYFAWRNHLSVGKIIFLASMTLIGLIFINSLFHSEDSDTLILSCIHLLLFLGSLLGFAFIGEEPGNLEKRLDFLKFMGDLLVISGLLCIAGAITTGITIGLFSLIAWEIGEFYFQNIVKIGLPAVPIVGAFLTQTNPHLVGKVSPVIAKIFSPIVLVMLIIYLVAMVYSGKNPYNDREFLLLFNALLIGVMAIIFFSVAGTSYTAKSRAEIWILFLLSTVTILVNGVALLAILFRISEWGITPNRAAVLGANMLILINLLWVTAQLILILHQRKNLNSVGEAIGLYLPVYALWAIIVTFLFPFLFGFE